MTARLSVYLRANDDGCLPFQFQPTSTDLQIRGILASRRKLNVVSFGISLEYYLGIPIESRGERLDVRFKLSSDKSPYIV